MGRNRKKSGIGTVEAVRYDIFGNVIGEEESPASVENPPVQPPVAAPEGYTNDRTLAIARKASYDRNTPYETLVMLDDAGNVVLQKDGGRRSVAVARTSDIPWDRAAVISHNHPEASSFSSDDFIVMHKRGLSGMEARAPEFSKTERAFVDDVVAAMIQELRVQPLMLNPYTNATDNRPLVKQLTRDFIKELKNELAVFAKNKKKPWRFITTNPEAIRNPPPEQRLTANTSTEELIGLLITQGEGVQRNPNDRFVNNMGIPRRKQIITDALRNLNTDENNLRNVGRGIQLRLTESKFWKKNPERAQQLSRLVINAMLSHASNKVALRDSTYQYDVVFE